MLHKQLISTTFYYVYIVDSKGAHTTQKMDHHHHACCMLWDFLSLYIFLCCSTRLLFTLFDDDSFVPDYSSSRAFAIFIFFSSFVLKTFFLMLCRQFSEYNSDNSCYSASLFFGKNIFFCFPLYMWNGNEKKTYYYYLLCMVFLISFHKCSMLFIPLCCFFHNEKKLFFIALNFFFFLSFQTFWMR
jgi:hypothetical protein